MSNAWRFVSTVLFAAAAVGAGPAAAQEPYPNRPIKLVVADSPGTNSDTLARVFGAEMAKTLGQPVVIENRPGASYRIGWEHASKQPPDGYTITLVNVPGLVSLPLIAKELRFDPLKDLPPIMGLVEGRITLTTAASGPVSSFKDLVAMAKATPGKLNYGTSGIISRLPMEAVKKTFGVDITMVGYKAGNLYLQGVLTGEVHVGVLGEQSAMGFGDRVRVLAVSGTTRVAQWPDVPTFAEVGIPAMVGNYFTLNAPAGIPKVAQDRLYAAGQKAMQAPEVKAFLAKLKFEAVPPSPQAAAQNLAQQASLYRELGKAAGIQPD